MGILTRRVGRETRLSTGVGSHTERRLNMDQDRFDTLTRSLTHTGSRRGLSRLLGGLTLCAPLALLGRSESEAKRKKKKKKKKKSGRTPSAVPPPPASTSCTG